MPVSNPLWENTQISAAMEPLAGRTTGIGFPARLQLLVAVEKTPNAPTFRSTEEPGASTPAVVGSTTTMSLPSDSGAAALRLIERSDVFGGAITKAMLLEVAPSGLRICKVRFAGALTSAAKIGAEH